MAEMVAYFRRRSRLHVGFHLPNDRHRPSLRGRLRHRELAGRDPQLEPRKEP